MLTARIRITAATISNRIWIMVPATGRFLLLPSDRKMPGTGERKSRMIAIMKPRVLLRVAARKACTSSSDTVCPADFEASEAAWATPQVSRSDIPSSSLRRKSVDTPKNSATAMILLRSGVVCDISHLETAWRLTPILSPNCSCDSPLLLRSSVIFSPKTMSASLQ